MLTPIHSLSSVSIPFYMSPVSAGFPSPADDFIENGIDLNTYLIKNPSATFMVRATGLSMIDAGIHSGDILIVDRSCRVVSQNIVVAQIDGEFLVKRYVYQKAHYLISENESYAPIRVESECDFSIVGVVTFVIHQPQ